jgi:hypothetical protein
MLSPLLYENRNQASGVRLQQETESEWRRLSACADEPGKGRFNDQMSRSLGHVPIIDKNCRGQEVVPRAPHEAARHRERTVVERCNGRLKEDFGANNVMVRGPTKVMLHLMFGVVALFADQLLKLMA